MKNKIKKKKRREKIEKKKIIKEKKNIIKNNKLIIVLIILLILLIILTTFFFFKKEYFEEINKKNNQETIIRGVITEELGTRMAPYAIGKINDYYLFYPNKTIFNYKNYLNKEVLIKGSLGKTNFTIEDFLKRNKTIICNKSIFIKEIKIIK